MENKTADLKKYMREYQKKKYDEDPSIARKCNKKSYYKSKFGLNTDEMILFDGYLKEYGLILQNIETLQTHRPDLAILVLKKIEKKC